MATLLFIHSSPRGDYSVSTTLGKQFVAEWQKNNADGKVVSHDATQEKFPFVDVPWMGGAYTPAEKRTPEQSSAIKVSDDLIDELLAADTLLIATPMYNFSIPASLKAWIDHVVRAGRTFDPGTAQGLVTGKKAIIIMASGFNYADGAPFAAYNMATSYLKQVLGFIGITDVQVVLAGETSGVMQGKISMEDYIAQHSAEVVSAAK